ncbi:MAG TPA: hypothetical protein VH988_21130 [Thermoanaerobaculia bacterium]|jgi:hypothetical protein|nr:hypothetical protein [Thermoanaerobaculia bacterium]
MLSESQKPGWPAQPYKGLSYYGPEDAPLLAGREHDVVGCANLLGFSSTRILLLHGSTGCGKSSFLRAGLIPYLEDAGFQFIPEDGERRVKALFVRSTDCPLMKLAEGLHDFASRDFEMETPIGIRTIKLSLAVAKHGTREEFLEKAGNNAELLTELLNELASKLPKTLILVVDQGEEVLTLEPSKKGDDAREEFFKFLNSFSRTDFDLKILVALRTEYYGKFQNKVRQWDVDPVDIRDYLLGDLTEQQLVRAIERPTSEGDVLGYGSPHDHYKFSFAEGLPQKIASDLLSKNLAGGTLPVLQVVCDRLYQKTKKQPGIGWVISDEDFLLLGGVEGQMEENLEHVLTDMCLINRLPNAEIPSEVDRWKDVLCQLAKSQVDGTVTTDVRTADELLIAAEKQDCRIGFERAMQHLASEETRILRRVDVIRLDTKVSVRCYSLGHDAIGLVLQQWTTKRKEFKNVANRTRLRLRWLGGATVCFGLLACTALLPLGGEWREFWPVGMFWALYGLLFWSAGWKEDWYERILAATLPLYMFILGKRRRARMLSDSSFRDQIRQYPRLRKRFEKLANAKRSALNSSTTVTEDSQRGLPHS